jgi:hypothetical protein
MSGPQHLIIVGDAALPAGDCGCCEDEAGGLPALANRPGLSAIAYRVGTHARFKHEMLAALSDFGRPALARLRTRDDDDFSIAFLDGCATLFDVLTFYQERIANESYLRTATERLSVIEVAQLIGYLPRPGVAAATTLVFTLDEAAGAPEQAVKQTTIGIGTRVQSIPGPSQQAQTFETVEAITARIEWNAMKPRRSEPGGVQLQKGFAYLNGTGTNLNPGDAVVFINEERIAGAGTGQCIFRHLRAADADHAENRTRIAFESYNAGPLTGTFHCFALRTRASLFGYSAPHPKSLHDSIIGHYTDDIGADGDWIFAFGDNGIDLDSTYPQILKGGWLILAGQDGSPHLYGVKDVSQAARASYAVTGKTTRIELDADISAFAGINYRGTAVYAQSEELAIAERPLDEAMFGDNIVLDRIVPDLAAGRALFVRGRCARVKVAADNLAFVPAGGGLPGKPLRSGQTLRLLGPPSPGSPGSNQKVWQIEDDDEITGRVTAADGALVYVPAVKGDEIRVELAAVKSTAAEDARHTRLTFGGPLANAYDRWSVEILGNVALATHGESVSEILGGGNAAETFQQFTLKQAPLTYVAANSASGAASSLQVRVSDVLWREVPTLFGHSPQHRVYITRMADDGKVTVEFGDGRSGARLPSGQDNVRAVYRKGIGLAGLVNAGQLSMLLSRPLGVTGASNPQAASGAADPENIDDARGNAPIGVLTLDRTVSLRDYEDFARGFAGVAKALASWSWDGRMRRIFITIAGPNGADIASSSDLYQHLVAGIGNAGDPFVTFEVKSLRLAHFRAALKVKIGDRLAETVLRDVETALRSRFSFAARSFGQTVNMSEVIAVAQDVPGVEAIDLDRLYRTTPPADAPVVNPRLPAALPGIGPDGHMVAAEILVLDPGPLDLAVMP